MFFKFSNFTAIYDTLIMQAKELMVPLLGNNAGNIFAVALLLAGISSTVTSGMAAGSISAGIFGE